MIISEKESSTREKVLLLVFGAYEIAMKPTSLVGAHTIVCFEPLVVYSRLTDPK